ncbi:MAG: hypothetical protein ACI9XK_004405, partial [Granulosicoccus sp.]
MNFYFLAPLFLGLLTNWAPTLLFAADEGSNS